MVEQLDPQQSTPNAPVSATDGVDPALWHTLATSALTALTDAPDYYPPIFNTTNLARQLQLFEVADTDFLRFSSTSLYWGGALSHEPIQATQAQFVDEAITVVLVTQGPERQL